MNIKNEWEDNIEEGFELPMNRKIGDQVWYVSDGIAIKCTIVEIQDIYELSKETVKKHNLSSSTLWANKWGPGNDYTDFAGYRRNVEHGEDNPSESDINADKNILDNAKHVNQFIWLDELIGHELFYDAVFDTKEETEQYIKEECADEIGQRPLTLEQFRQKCKDWLTRNHQKPIEEMEWPEWVDSPKKECEDWFSY